MASSAVCVGPALKKGHYKRKSATVTSTGGAGESVHFFTPSIPLLSSVEHLYFTFLLRVAYIKKQNVMGG